MIEPKWVSGDFIPKQLADVLVEENIAGLTESDESDDEFDNLSSIKSRFSKIYFYSFGPMLIFNIKIGSLVLSYLWNGESYITNMLPYSREEFFKGI